LRGFLRHSNASEFWVRVNTPDHAHSCTAAARAAGRMEPIKVVGKNELASLALAGSMY